MSDHKIIDLGAEDELAKDKYERDLAFVNEKMEKAQKALDKAENSYQLSGGYGSRSNIIHYQNQVKLCRLALKGLENQCTACTRRRRNAMKMISDLESEKKELGISTISIDRTIDLINTLA